MRRVPDDELESYLAGSAEGTRHELAVEQIAPFVQEGVAYVPIAKGHEDAVRARVAEYSSALSGVLAVESTDAVVAREPEFYASMAPALTALRIGHASDRTYAGYGPIVNELRALAAHLDDARWTIAELQGDWIDDFHVKDGKLSARRFCGTEDMSSQAEILEAMADGDDEELRAHALLERTRDAHAAIFDAFHCTGEERAAAAERARRQLDRARAFPPAVAERSLLELLFGTHEMAKKSADRAIALADSPLAHFVAALIDLAGDRRNEARAHAEAATAKAPWMAEAHLLALGGTRDREHTKALFDLATGHATAYPNHLGGPWDRLRVAILVRAKRSESLDAALLATAGSGGASRKGAALLLVVYGEALRLANACMRARPFYERAISFDSMNGEIEKRMAWLK